MRHAPRSAIHPGLKRKTIAIVLPLCFGWLALARSADIVQNFQGVVYSDVVSLGSAGTPPDTMGAVGLNEFVEFVNGAFSVYSKTGVRQSIISDKQFWTNAGISPTIVNAGISDPRINFRHRQSGPRRPF